jgi:Protein of unknown function (DUF2971)
MLLGRIFEPADGQILYHYCSAETLRAILESRTLRFTDVTMLNDAQEMRLGYRAFEEAATRIINRTGIGPEIDIIPRAFFDDVDKTLSRTQTIAHPFVSCFSLDGDDLGQWRAYAADGQGFAIGFSASLIRELPVSVLAVEYDWENQVKEMMVALLATHEHRKDTSNVSPNAFGEDCVLIGVYSVGFKHSAFRHEREIRCVHVNKVDFTDGRLRFIDPGGENSSGHQFDAVPIRFEVRNNHLCAYQDLPFSWTEGAHPVAELVLGPKNYSYLGNIFLYLGGLGYGDVPIRQSAIPYR